MELVGTRVDAGGGGLSFDQESLRIRMERMDAVSHEDEAALLLPVEGRFWWECVEFMLERRKGCLIECSAVDMERWKPGRETGGG